MSVIELTYKILLFVKTFSVRIFSLILRITAPYFLIYNAEEYEDIFEEDFIIVNELNHYNKIIQCI